MTIQELQSCLCEWRNEGQTIVFTNGCFDLLHVGHVTLLEEARLEGDRLIVGINSDASIRGIKGPSRPIVSQDARLRVLAGLAAVDAVVIFEQPTPIELIKMIRADVLVKGGDYLGDEIVGASEVRSWGGRVKIVPFVPGFSTTSIVRAAAPE